jgi:hypothetical protein
MREGWESKGWERVDGRGVGGEWNVQDHRTDHRLIMYRIMAGVNVIKKPHQRLVAGWSYGGAEKKPVLGVRGLEKAARIGSRVRKSRAGGEKAARARKSRAERGVRGQKKPRVWRQ